MSFEVFKTSDDQQILMRNITDGEETAQSAAVTQTPSIESVCVLADEKGIGPQFRALLAAAERHGLYAKPFKHSIMYASPKHRGKMLFTAWANPLAGGLMRVWIAPQVFADYYPVTAEQATELLGVKDEQRMTAEAVKDFIDGLDRLFASMQQPG